MKMAEPRLGLQLIVYGGRQDEDLGGVLEEVAEVGYDGVEIGSNFVDEVGPEAVTEALDATGLQLCGVHGGYAGYTDTAWVAQAIEFCKACNCEYLICSGVSDRSSLQGYLDSAPTFDAVGEQCRDAGLTFCYHNHAFEFDSFEGTKGIHALIGATDPDLMKLCVDVFWVHIGREDPAEFIARYGDRTGYYHFKDGFQGPEFIELGDGEVDLVSARQAAMKLDPAWIVCEQDRTELEPRESIARSLAYLRKIGA
jgi:sugar phosphate isomerase/epimerase